MNNPLAGRRIFVVEDEVMVLWMLVDMLAAFGCEVVGPAGRLSQALKILDEATDIDAAVLDINLNGEKSYPVADALAARGVPFVFSSGYQRDRLLNGYKTCPMIQKPYGRSTLSDALIQLLTPEQVA
jgi:CheY-like chemotaxis protein